MPILLDTSVIVDCLRRHALAMDYFRKLEEVPTISVVSLAEVAAGMRSARQETDATEFLQAVKPLAINREVAWRAGAFMRLYRASHTLELGDALIAATAEYHDQALATLNTKHFPMFPRLRRPY